MTVRHPDTGFHYVFLILRAEPFLAIREGYLRLSERLPWLSVVEMRSDLSAILDDPDNFVISWGSWGIPELIAGQVRRAKTALAYFEPLGPLDQMLPDHREYLQHVYDHLPHFDAILLHTPMMRAEMASRVQQPCYVLPVGLDASQGVPDFGAEKRYGYLHWGSMAGDRPRALAEVKAHLGDRVTNVVGLFGAALHAELNAAKGALYLPHSRVSSFSTWRIWQVIASSAGLIAPAGSDAWPLEPGRHYVEYDLDRPDYDALAHLLDGAALRDVALRACAEIGPRFTMERCVNDYLVPASKEFRCVS